MQLLLLEAELSQLLLPVLLDLLVDLPYMVLDVLLRHMIDRLEHLLVLILHLALQLKHLMLYVFYRLLKLPGERLHRVGL